MSFYSLQAIQIGIKENHYHTRRMYRLLRVFAGHTGLIVGVVLHWLIYQYFLYKKVSYLIGLDKRGYPINIFLISPQKTYVVGTHQKHLDEVLLMSTHNICFCGLFVYVEVLRPSQPNGVMSSVVSFLTTHLLGRLSPLSG